MGRGRIASTVLVAYPLHFNPPQHNLPKPQQLWNAEPAVKVIALKGAGDKAFCAGGDVVRIAGSGQ